MFPWSPDFVWDTGHLVFLVALCAVLAAIGTSLVLAARRGLLRVRRGRVAGAAWHAEFAELPGSVRACRHQITGEAPERLCEKAFDCRRCVEHELLEAKRERPAARAPEASARPRLRPEPSLLPSRPHLGASREERHGDDRPRRHRAPAARDPRSDRPGAARRAHRDARHARPRQDAGDAGATAVADRRHGRRPARQRRSASSCACGQTRRSTSATCWPDPRRRSGRCASWSAWSAPSDRSAPRSRSPTAASWWPTSGRSCPASATTPSSARRSWRRESVAPRSGGSPGRIAIGFPAAPSGRRGSDGRARRARGRRREEHPHDARRVPRGARLPCHGGALGGGGAGVDRAAAVRPGLRRPAPRRAERARPHPRPAGREPRPRHRRDHGLRDGRHRRARDQARGARLPAQAVHAGADPSRRRAGRGAALAACGACRSSRDSCARASSRRTSRPLAAHAAGVRHRAARGGLRRLRPAARRERHGQGRAGAPPARPQRARRRAPSS